MFVDVDPNVGRPLDSWQAGAGARWHQASAAEHERRAELGLRSTLPQDFLPPPLGDFDKGHHDAVNLTRHSAFPAMGDPSQFGRVTCSRGVWDGQSPLAPTRKLNGRRLSGRQKTRRSKPARRDIAFAEGPEGDG